MMITYLFFFDIVYKNEVNIISTSLGCSATGGSATKWAHLGSLWCFCMSVGPSRYRRTCWFATYRRFSSPLSCWLMKFCFLLCFLICRSSLWKGRSRLSPVSLIFHVTWPIEMRLFFVLFLFLQYVHEWRLHWKTCNYRWVHAWVCPRQHPFPSSICHNPFSSFSWRWVHREAESFLPFFWWFPLLCVWGSSYCLRWLERGTVRHGQDDGWFPQKCDPSCELACAWIYLPWYMTDRSWQRSCSIPSGLQCWWSWRFRSKAHHECVPSASG